MELRGGWLEKMDLTNAIRQYAGMLEDQYPISITVSVEGIPTRFQRYVERQIFSIAKESMTNACKHAKAEHIDVRLKYAEDQFLLLVTDDGIGFKDNPLYKSGHFGLLGMEERANRINGKLLINDAEHAGVQIELSVFVNEYQEPDDE